MGRNIAFVSTTSLQNKWTIYYDFDSWSHLLLCFKAVFQTLLGSPYAIVRASIYFRCGRLRDQLSAYTSVLCRMKMLPVMISANYHSSARSAVSESPNSSARLVSQCPNSSARLVSQCPNSSARLVFPMFQVELASRF